MARDVGEPTAGVVSLPACSALAEVDNADSLSEMLFRYRRMRVRDLLSPPDDGEGYCIR